MEGEHPTGACVDVGGEGEWDRLFVGWPVVRHTQSTQFFHLHASPVLYTRVVLLRVSGRFRTSLLPFFVLFRLEMAAEWSCSLVVGAEIPPALNFCALIN